MKKLLFFIVLLSPQLSLSQSKIPYPIIFVHGLIGNSMTWSAFANHLSNQN